MANLYLNNHTNSPPGPNPPYHPPSPSYIQAEPSQRLLTLKAGPASSYCRFLSMKNLTASSSTEPTLFSLFPLSLPQNRNLHYLSNLTTPCHHIAQYCCHVFPSQSCIFVFSFYDSTATFIAPRTREGYKAKTKKDSPAKLGHARRGKEMTNMMEAKKLLRK